RPAPKRRFRHIRSAAEFGDLGQNLVVFHRKRIGMPVGQLELTGQSYHYLPNRQNAGRGPPGPA
ncbi:MAG TPA: hypothetical protein VJR30_19900, partial [Bradyrhizobium sp.]|nr:hypothetical protein [Bradyrhizobium sp.]